MVGGILKHVGHAAPGQQCTQCGTQVRLLSQEWYIFLFHLYLWYIFHRSGISFIFMSFCFSPQPFTSDPHPTPLFCLLFGDEYSRDCWHSLPCLSDQDRHSLEER